MKILDTSSASITEAVQLLLDGALVVLPTETVYGLSAIATDDTAVASIYTAKGRPQDNPCIVHVSDSMMANAYGSINTTAQLLINAYWPGPLTIVVPALGSSCLRARAGGDTIALRAPAHTVMQQIIQTLEVPLAAPSANKSGKPSPTTAAHVISDYKDDDRGIAAIIDGGLCAVGVESTVVDCTTDVPVILRPGSITAEMIAEVLHISTVQRIGDTETSLRSPGTKYRHYAPDTPVRLIETLPRDISGEIMILSYNSNIPNTVQCKQQNIYQLFREADAEERYREIYILDSVELRADVALFNRIQKAISPTV